MNIRPDITTREAWLEEAVRQLRPLFTEAGLSLPELVRVSTGFGITIRGENASILGQTIATGGSTDGVPSVFISPVADEPVQVLGILVHELLHVENDCRDGHKGDFWTNAQKLGCKGPATQALPDVALEAALVLIAEQLGEYPHKAIDVAKVFGRVEVPVGPDGQPIPVTKVYSGPARQGTRMIKVECREPGCMAHGYTLRMTRKWLDLFGAPSCPGGESERPGVEPVEPGHLLSE